MRYAIFTDVHANLEALEAVLAKIDELGQQEPIEQIWFLGDLVGYGPNPNECIEKLRERTDAIIAGNHDWAAVGKIDLEDFSEAARISAEWTAKQLTEEHRDFLQNLPERLEKDECLLVHGSPYGPLWEYLTSEVLAERSFQYFTQRFCLVGHTHVPALFQQPDAVATAPTIPLGSKAQDETITVPVQGETEQDEAHFDDDDTTEMATIRPQLQTTQVVSEHTPAVTDPLQSAVTDVAAAAATAQQQRADDEPGSANHATPLHLIEELDETGVVIESDEETTKLSAGKDAEASEDDAESTGDTEEATPEEEDANATFEQITPEETIQSAEERLNEEIEELLGLLGLSQSMISVTNEMVIPPEGDWQPPEGYRAIVNPGGVGQPRDGDPRAAFMIYDTERGFTFYRIPYPFEKTQEKIIKAGLPRYLATRLAYGR